ncbi:diguanylate cyclase [Dokdonella sp.]|uniref:GGDEF domain-containing protein n=1 Tax=Dokdonella sp. TaxID=2291710 RepID=UPI0025B9E7C2|nr:diguanylate cyclase [Dokdonella sp.]MBX3689140.1 GGDEF domain-containing protein [Dokdonella sp.]
MFNLFTWNDAFVTAIPLVDEQHRVLVDLINQLGELCTSAKDIGQRDFVAARDALVAYAEAHFRDEEAHMAKCGLDPRFQRTHCAAHWAFVKRVQHLGGGAEQSPRSMHAVLDYLVCWLTDHILVVDLSMARQEQAILAGKSPQQAYDEDMQFTRPSAEPVTAALRGLLWKLAESNDQLRKLNHELEQRVEERTADLDYANRQLRILSNQDDLTGLPNHRYAVTMLDHLWALAADTPFAILLLDADRFKVVNDKHGHAIGDELLRHLAQRLRDAVRSSDIVCRFGGDEFLVICPDSNRDCAIKVAQFVLDAQTPFFAHGQEPCWDGALSIGVATVGPGIDSIQALLESADRALYRAKQNGGSRFALDEGPRAA